MLVKNEMLRHFLAALAYRGTKAIKSAPDHYPDLDVGKGVKSPRRILAHISGVLTYAHSFYEQYETTRFATESWGREVSRFYEILKKLDKSFSESTPREVTEEQILQGPLSDAMTHIGQLCLLRRLADSPIPSENFIFADIKKGQVGPDQPQPVAPDE
ncbi:MAG: hypothetical protein ACE5I5_20465 [Candidatus Heimdallarchaeota archaeon]